MTQFVDWLRTTGRGDFETYDALWQWSVDELELFWGSLWSYFELSATSTPYEEVLRGSTMPGVQWFPGARTNYARHALSGDAATPRLRFESEAGRSGEWSAADLRREVAAVAAWLRAAGVGPGDRVVGYLPNVPEAVVAFLATASVGAAWASCAPDIGVPSVLDRFRQIEPKALVAVDGYVYAGRRYDRRAEVARLQAELPSLAATLHVSHLGERPLAAATRADDYVDVVQGVGAAAPTFEEVPWDHPLWILFTSGTTGLPKPIVHGHGGILIEHLKTHALHLDLGADDVFFWYTSTSWMMWNFLVSGLLAGSSIVLFDGSPSFPTPSRLWQLAEEQKITFFGTSAPFIELCMAEDVRPCDAFDLGSIRTVASTASPLSAAGFKWVYDSVGSDVLLASASGGTDVCTPFVGSCPLLPVRAGEIQCRLLGAAVQAFDDDGQPTVGSVGELVVTRPMPSMPLFFWNDVGGRQYRESYFDMFPGVWRHGDWATITERGSVIIHGRSDSTIKRGGVRTGTSEFYRVLDELEGVVDSLVVDTPAWSSGRSEIVLFVVLAEGERLGDLERTIQDALRTRLSPRHVPDRIFEVAGIPRTLNGKKLEVPVKRILEGTPVGEALSRDTLADPGAVDVFEALAAELAAPGSRD